MTVIQQVSADRMKIIIFSPLLLLVCSVSADQTETAVQQSCPQDIHALLRELTASLAVQTERITVLQREQEQAVRLKQQKTEIDQLKLLSKEQEAKLESQKTEINQLKQQSEEQEGKVETQKTELQSQKTEIDQLKLQLTQHLKQQLQVKQVAFSASQLEQGEGNTGPFTQYTYLIFKHVVTNIGNAYNPHTGIFTAPVRGVYHFDCKVYGHSNNNPAFYLAKNDILHFRVIEYLTSGSGSASNGASFLLEVGDRVSINFANGASIYDNQDHHNTFSGHLLFAM
ncbi:fibroblast growth factor receptor 3 [Sarotherodon galilaeus]